MNLSINGMNMFTQWKMIAATLIATALLSVGAQPALAKDHNYSCEIWGGAAHPQRWQEMGADDNLR
uniref:Uncharacterized protein n=1 Tax=mine drainage metagenome TaxID=410659 RepID=E6QPL8_9ZZZZ